MDALAMIMAYESNEKLRDLTEKRTPASIPFGGRYRLIDFALSNMVNSGITKVGIITHNNYLSLMDHVGDGKEWDLNRKRDGLYFLPPMARGDAPTAINGWVDALSSAMTFIRRSREKYVIIAEGDWICNIDYTDAVRFHEESGADITCLYRNVPDGFTSNSMECAFEMEGGRITGVLIDPRTDRARSVCAEMYIMERTLLERLVGDAIARGQHSFMEDILRRNVDKLKLFGFELTGFLRKIDSVDAYMTTSMELLDPEVREALFGGEKGGIYTKVRDEMPARYQGDAKVSNSLITDGCLIEGEVTDSVLFRGVRVGKGAVISNCILMQKCEILPGAHLENVIVDKDAVIRSDTVLIGQKSVPVVIGKGKIV